MNRPDFDQLTDREERRLGTWINRKSRKQIQGARMKAELEQEPKIEREPNEKF